MENQEILDRLQDLGLTEYQSRGYLAAVNLGTSRPRKLAETADIPQPRIYDVISDLEEFGFVEVQERSGGKEVVAPPPSGVLELFRDRQVQELTETVETVAADLEALHDREERFEDFVTMVGTWESALRHMRRVIDSAEWWLTLAVSLETYDTLVEHVRDAVDRGVTVLIAVHRNGTGSVAEAEFLDSLEVRTRPLADTMVLADRRYGVFSSRSPHRDDESYIVTQDTNLVFLFQNYFHNFWTGSETIQSDGEFPRRYLDPWRAIIDVRDELDAGADLYASVSGYHNTLRRSGRWEGPIVDHEISGPVPADYSVVIPAKAALFVDVDGAVSEVGGRKATLADIAADGIEVDRLDD